MPDATFWQTHCRLIPQPDRNQRSYTPNSTKPLSRPKSASQTATFFELKEKKRRGGIAQLGGKTTQYNTKDHMSSTGLEKIQRRCRICVNGANTRFSSYQLNNTAFQNQLIASQEIVDAFAVIEYPRLNRKYRVRMPG